MKKLFVIIIIIISCLCWQLRRTVFAQPTVPFISFPIPPDRTFIDVNDTVVKIDDKSCEITTITTTTHIARRPKADLQTELDHIPNRLAKIQKEIDKVNKRRAKLIEILKVFE